MLKVVLDTNIFVAGYLSKNQQGYPSQILSSWRAGAFTLVISPSILREIVAKLLDKGVSEDLLQELVATIGQIGLNIPGAYETCKLDTIDPDDNKFLAAGLESQADYIVSYDAKSLLPLKHFHGTQILLPELFMRQLMGIEPDQSSEENGFSELEAQVEALKAESWERHQQSVQERQT